MSVCGSKNGRKHLTVVHGICLGTATKKTALRLTYFPTMKKLHSIHPTQNTKATPPTAIQPLTRGPFLERLGNLTGLISYFENKVSRRVGCVLTSNEVHFVSLAANFTGKQNSLTGPVIIPRASRNGPQVPIWKMARQPLHYQSNHAGYVAI